MEVIIFTAVLFWGAKICGKLYLYASTKATSTACHLERCSWLLGAANFALSVFVLCALGTLFLFEIGKAAFGSYQEKTWLFNSAWICVSLLFSRGMLPPKTSMPPEESNDLVGT